MTLDELNYIKKVCEEKNILKASKKLYISQPALSYCIKKVEKHLGVKLFIRNRNGLELTKFGEEYYEMATKVIDIYANFEESVSPIKDQIIINFGITQFLSKHYMHLIYGEIKSKLPNIKLNLVEDNSTNLGEMILKNELDLALMHKSTKETFNTFDTKVLFEDFFVIVTKKGAYSSNDSIEFEGNKINIMDIQNLEGENFISLKKSKKIQEINNLLFENWNFKPKNYMTLDSFETAINMASSGNGVFIVPYQYLKVIKNIDNIDTYMLSPNLIYSWETCIISNPQKAAALKSLKKEIANIYDNSFYKL